MFKGEIRLTKKSVLEGNKITKTYFQLCFRTRLFPGKAIAKCLHVNIQTQTVLLWSKTHFLAEVS